MDMRGSVLRVGFRSAAAVMFDLRRKAPALDGRQE
jgi:hypothetical protein